MTTVAISTTAGHDGEYLRAVMAAGGTSRLLAFDIAALDAQLAGVGGVLLSGGGDVDPRHYGVANELAADINPKRDAFELALVRRARVLGIPTLCICRGLQIANVALGGTLVCDIGTVYGAKVAADHRVEVDGKSVRTVIANHYVDIEPGSLLSSIVPAARIATGSRHHQCVAALAADLRVVAKTSDGIIEAAELRSTESFWLAVQWHPESTLDDDSGASRAIFAAFVAAAGRLSPFKSAS